MIEVEQRDMGVHMGRAKRSLPARTFLLFLRCGSLCLSQLVYLLTASTRR